ncbi:pre-mRNA-splicing factor Cwc2p [[Candida] railenensis]|uniref:Pre-mRNA-splicing factor CWC2 n=1 Tax=[Candida] railenensis TaxID=45579 RepID=A0A9P0QT27_9ASCO|nr:pre-mRNA-splicing factor Cwc2p [[Candida] railenensis]
MANLISDRPARLQVDPNSIADDDKPPQTGTSFNIWFLKWSGGDSSSKNYVKSKFRLNVKKDSGSTRAPSNSPICLFFARGCCYKGPKCNYQHRLPSSTKHSNIPTQDCFGRDKTADYKDDMDGVGSFNRYNRTLYVGGLNSISNNKIENVLTKHFQEFGSIDKIRVLYDKGCAFISFKTEEEAQFAKEAMQSQSLDDDEILNIRWASEDPNPHAQRQEQRRLEEKALETVKQLLSQVEEKENKRRKVTVEEVEEEYEGEEESVKLISAPPAALPQIGATDPSSSSSSSFFSGNSLAELKSIRRKILLPTPSPVLKESKVELKDMLAYDSDD